MFASYLQWFHGLPVWGQVFVSYLGWPFLPWLALGIWEQRSGLEGRPHRAKWWQALAFFVAAFYLKEHAAWARDMLSWPDRFIPYWRDYWYCVLPAFVLSGLIAKQVAIAYVRMTSGASRPSAGLSHGDFAPGFISIIRRRTFTTWEDE